MKTSMFADPAGILSRQREIAIQEGRGCEQCGSIIDVTRESRGTAYEYKGEHGDENDPNMASLCQKCWPIERAYWEEMWREYWSGRL